MQATLGLTDQRIRDAGEWVNSNLDFLSPLSIGMGLTVAGGLISGFSGAFAGALTGLSTEFAMGLGNGPLKPYMDKLGDTAAVATVAIALVAAAFAGVATGALSCGYLTAVLVYPIVGMAAGVVGVFAGEFLVEWEGFPSAREA